MYTILFVVSVFSLVRAGNFSNPVIPASVEIKPRCFSRDLIFYCVTSQNNQYVLTHSTDLQTWTAAGTLLETPSSVQKPNTYDPHLFVSSRGDIRLYIGRTFADSTSGIGAAYAQNILGPYYPFEWPLLVANTTGYPFAFEDDDGRTYLYYTNYVYILVQTLERDLLSSSSEPVSLQKAVTIYSPYVIKREGIYYLFYSTGTKYTLTVWVARSSTPTGPFTRIAMEMNDGVTFAGQCPSVVKGPDGQTDVLIYQAYDTNYKSLGIFAKVLIWTDGWPYAQ